MSVHTSMVCMTLAKEKGVACDTIRGEGGAGLNVAPHSDHHPHRRHRTYIWQLVTPQDIEGDGSAGGLIGVHCPIGGCTNHSARFNFAYLPFLGGQANNSPKHSPLFASCPVSIASRTLPNPASCSNPAAWVGYRDPPPEAIYLFSPSHDRYSTVPCFCARAGNT